MTDHHDPDQYRQMWLPGTEAAPAGGGPGSPGPAGSRRWPQRLTGTWAVSGAVAGALAATGYFTYSAIAGAHDAGATSAVTTGSSGHATPGSAVAPSVGAPVATSGGSGATSNRGDSQGEHQGTQGEAGEDS